MAPLRSYFGTTFSVHIWISKKNTHTKLRADGLHPRSPPDYRHGDKDLRLVMRAQKYTHTHKQAGERTDGRYQVHYLPASLKLKLRG